MLTQKVGEKTIIVYKDLPWYYAEMLDWHVENGVVKAFPKKPLSDTAHREISKWFKRQGGKFVRHNGVAYFERVFTPQNSASTVTAVQIRKAYEELQKER